MTNPEAAGWVMIAGAAVLGAFFWALPKVLDMVRKL